MKTPIGYENERVFWFGKRHRVAVKFTRMDGLWYAHKALLPEPARNIRDARSRVARELQIMAKPEGHWGAKR
jgi:hypothetical protein